MLHKLTQLAISKIILCCFVDKICGILHKWVLELAADNNYYDVHNLSIVLQKQVE